MPPPANPTIREHLAWAYANLAMAEKAVHDGLQKYGRQHFMIRSRIYRGMTDGSMSPRSLMRDQRIRMKLPQECVYCGSEDHLAVDHVVASHVGGADAGDNAIWACRSCNSSKRDRDLFAWWASKHDSLPPLFVVRLYLKQAIAWAEKQGIMGQPLEQAPTQPFDYRGVPTDYPGPAELIFTPFHKRKAMAAN